MYKCEIIADSLSPQSDRLTSFLVTYPRIVHAEMLRHRMFSRNVASSRAIPFKKMVKDIEENPFIPIAWQKDHKGMQGNEYITNNDSVISYWLEAIDQAVRYAKILNQSINAGVTKQLCNRLLEPFMWVTELITGTHFENFFKLRCPIYGDSAYGLDKCSTVFKSKKDYCKHFNIEENYQTNLQWFSHNYSQAEIHIQQIAEMMWDAYNESEPKKLESGQWHIPYGDNMDESLLNKTIDHTGYYGTIEGYNDFRVHGIVKIATARCARLSYTTLGDEPKIDYEADIKLHDKLLADNHMSPFEHCARVMSLDTRGWCNNFKGFIQYRHLIENERQ